MMKYHDSEFHKGSLVGRLSMLRNNTLAKYQSQLGVPAMRTVTFRLDGSPDVTRVLKVTQAGQQVVKAYHDTGVNVKLEDLVIWNVPRDIPVEVVQFSMVILGVEPATERAEVIWVDERKCHSYIVIIRTHQQR